MEKQATSLCEVYRSGEQNVTATDDELVVEEPLEIWLKQFQAGNRSTTELLMTTMRTPGDDIELVKGWLFSGGQIKSAAILSIEHTGTDYVKGGQGNRILVTLKPGSKVDYQKLLRQEYVNSSCGVCGQQSIEWLIEQLPAVDLANRISISESSVTKLVESLNLKQGVFKSTGGSHGVALFDKRCEVIDCKEDVGRHNAFDKLIGANLERFPGKFDVVISGRVSFEMVQKAAMAGISLIIAIGAPTSLAVDLCKEREIGLIGFVKETGFNLYTGRRQLAGY